MAVNLISLTTTEGAAIEVNPANIVLVETVKEVCQLTLAEGKVIAVRETQKAVRDAANRRPPDGN